MRLLDRVRWHLRVKRYSIRTEQAYLDWIRRFILFHRKRHPETMGEQEIAQFLSHLAIDQRVAASTQNQGFSALLFLYRHVLDRKLEYIGGVERVRRPPILPVVFTRAEARGVIAHLEGDYRIMGELLYGTGLRLMELLRLRVKDVDFGYNQIIVREGKGMRERRTILPARIKEALRLHLERVRQIHRQDLARGAGRVYMPFALDRKDTNASRDWRWQYVFPAAKLSADPRGGGLRRHHLGEKTSKMRSNTPFAPPVLARRPAATPSAIASPLIYSSAGPTFARFRSSLATKTFRLRWFTRMSSTNQGSASPVRSMKSKSVEPQCLRRRIRRKKFVFKGERSSNSR